MQSAASYAFRDHHPPGFLNALSYISVAQACPPKFTRPSPAAILNGFLSTPRFGRRAAACPGGRAAASPGAMALELERSRMAAEDARGQTFWFSGDRPVSWRDYAVQSNQRITQLTYDVIEPALVLVEDAAVEIRGGHANVAYNRLHDARRVLAQEEDSEDDGANPTEEDGPAESD